MRIVDNDGGSHAPNFDMVCKKCGSKNTTIKGNAMRSLGMGGRKKSITSYSPVKNVKTESQSACTVSYLTGYK